MTLAQVSALRTLPTTTRCVIYLWVPTADMEASRLACERHAERGGWTLVGFHADHSIKDSPDLADYALDDCRTRCTDRIITTQASLDRMGEHAAAWIRAVEATGCLVVTVDVSPGEHSAS
jgi:hypothetical protein